MKGVERLSADALLRCIYLIKKKSNINITKEILTDHAVT